MAWRVDSANGTDGGNLWRADTRVPARVRYADSVSAPEKIACLLKRVSVVIVTSVEKWNITGIVAARSEFGLRMCCFPSRHRGGEIRGWDSGIFGLSAAPAV
jgi:hypothetical protein